MANNRMWLKCECGEQFYLAKYYPTITNGWYTSLPTKAMAGEFSAETVHLEYAQEALTWFAKFQHFLETHSHESEHRMYCPAFSLEYEEPEER